MQLFKTIDDLEMEVAKQLRENKDRVGPDQIMRLSIESTDKAGEKSIHGALVADEHISDIIRATRTTFLSSAFNTSPKPISEVTKVEVTIVEKEPYKPCT